MNTYKVSKIEKPFTVDIPAEKVKKGDLGIYAKHIKAAKKEGAILEIESPYGVTYASPASIIKDGRIIYRHFLKPEPMMLYVLTPKYGNKPPEEEEPITLNNALANAPNKYLLQMKSLFNKHI